MADVLRRFRSATDDDLSRDVAEVTYTPLPLGGKCNDLHIPFFWRHAVFIQIPLGPEIWRNDLQHCPLRSTLRLPR